MFSKGENDKKNDKLYCLHANHASLTIVQTKFYLLYFTFSYFTLIRIFMTNEQAEISGINLLKPLNYHNIADQPRNAKHGTTYL